MCVLRLGFGDRQLHEYSECVDGPGIAIAAEHSPQRQNGFLKSSRRTHVRARRRRVFTASWLARTSARANLEKANLAYVNFQGANLEGANLRNAKLASADLSKAVLRTSGLAQGRSHRGESERRRSDGSAGGRHRVFPRELEPGDAAGRRFWRGELSRCERARSGSSRARACRPPSCARRISREWIFRAWTFRRRCCRADTRGQDHRRIKACGEWAARCQGCAPGAAGCAPTKPLGVRTEID